ncbi:hypothetical protein QE450_000864 [Paenibacillus sp. SORGH_AS306]|nr:hypothetical protein [Paenibacillus sp. SORGH_AS_0306]MDR6110407.1 hypothetical protein [Paenibacillus sp. SORGH_AS_0338]
MLGLRIMDEKKTGEFENFDSEEVYKIQSFKVSGHVVPRYFTRNASYVSISTLSECIKVFGFIQLDNGTLADESQISYISESKEKHEPLLAHFHNTEETAVIAKGKKELIKYLKTIKEFRIRKGS